MSDSDEAQKKLTADGLEWLKNRGTVRPVFAAGPAYGAPALRRAIADGTWPPIGSEQYEFDVVLVTVKPESRVRVAKALRKVEPSLPVHEALALTQDLPRAVFKGLRRVEAEDAAKVLQEAGAETRLR